MFSQAPDMLRRLIIDFRRDVAGAIAPIFALTLIPVMTTFGAAIDYSHANKIRANMQAALDAGMLAGAKDGSTNWAQTAAQIFKANLTKQADMGVTFTPLFWSEQGLVYKGSASASVPTWFLGLIHVPLLQMSVRATAIASEPDSSCILTLDHGQPTSDVSLKLNGAPIINLSGCSIRSNTALDCNGHDGNVTKSIASGIVSDCGNPRSYAPVVPDIYAPIASNITTQCGSARPGISWTAGTVPTGAGIKTITNGGRTEYHICGDLT